MRGARCASSSAVHSAYVPFIDGAPLGLHGGIARLEPRDSGGHASMRTGLRQAHGVNNGFGDLRFARDVADAAVRPFGNELLTVR